MSGQPLTTNANFLGYPSDVSGSKYVQQNPSDVTASTRQIIAAKTPIPVRNFFSKSNDYRLTLNDGKLLLNCITCVSTVTGIDFLAGGGYLYYSTDGGATWNQDTISTPFLGIVNAGIRANISGYQWVIGGQSNGVNSGFSIALSADGYSWTIVQIDPVIDTVVRSITIDRSANTVYAGGSFKSSVLLYKSLNGISWTAVPSPDIVGFQSIVTDGTNLVVSGASTVSGTGASIFWVPNSPGPLTNSDWTQSTWSGYSQGSGTIRLTYGNGYFYAIWANLIANSTDGKTFTTRYTGTGSTPSFLYNIMAIHCNSSRVVAVGLDNSGNGYVAYSTNNGTSWTQVSVPALNNIYAASISWSDTANKFVISAYTLTPSVVELYSADATSWTTGTSTAIGTNYIYSTIGNSLTYS